ncbi:hypothetical protein KI387_038238, partial [Taxus chinensis]
VCGPQVCLLQRPNLDWRLNQNGNVGDNTSTPCHVPLLPDVDVATRVLVIERSVLSVATSGLVVLESLSPSVGQPFAFAGYISDSSENKKDDSEASAETGEEDDIGDELNTSSEIPEILSPKPMEKFHKMVEYFEEMRWEFYDRKIMAQPNHSIYVGSFPFHVDPHQL